MGLISDVKCSRCDRRYSGLRTRCPYCGARRSQKGKRTSEDENSGLKIIIGALLILVLVIAAVVLIVTSNSKENDDNNADDNKNNVQDNNSDYNANDGVTSIDDPDDVNPPNTGITENVPGENDDTNQPVNDVKVDSVTITYAGSATADFTMKVTESLNLGYKVSPEGYEPTQVTWASSDENIFVVLQSGKVTAVGAGTAELTVTVDGVSAKCVVRVKS